MTPEAMLSHHARSFAPAARLLAREDHARVARLYALCRTVDDLADNVGGAAVASRLARLADDLSSEGCGGRDPLAAEARALFAAHPDGLASFAHLVSTVADDTGRTCLADEAALDAYCMGVAGTVGVMVCTLFDVSPRWHAAAADLGRAMQLTNICRDVAEDARAGRRYLPYRDLPAQPGSHCRRRCPGARRCAPRGRTFAGARRYALCVRAQWAARPAAAPEARRHRRRGNVCRDWR